MSQLSKRYDDLKKEYANLVTDALENPSKVATNFEKIKQVNLKLSGVLGAMLTELAKTKASPQNTTLLVRRQEFENQLLKIQNDYTGLIKTTDKLETLKRIRAFESSGWKEDVMKYLIFFLVAVLILLIVVFVKRYLADKMAAMPSIPTTIAPLT